MALVIAQLVNQIKRGGSLLPHPVLPARTGPAGRRDPRLRLPAQPGHRAGQHDSSGSSASAGHALWFNDPAWSKPALVLLALWGIGDLMVIFMAALLDVPKEQYEAADAGRRRRLAAVPLSSPCRTSRRSCCSPWSPASSRRCSTSPRPRSRGGRRGHRHRWAAGSGERLGYPDKSTLTFPQLALRTASANFALGYACVLALVLFVVSMAFTVVLLRRARVFLHGAEGA